MKSFLARIMGQPADEAEGKSGMTQDVFSDLAEAIDPDHETNVGTDDGRETQRNPPEIYELETQDFSPRADPETRPDEPQGNQGGSEELFEDFGWED